MTKDRFKHFTAVAITTAVTLYLLLIIIGTLP